MDGKETAKRKQVLEGNATFYEIDLECMRKKEKREREMEKGKRGTETETVSLKEYFMVKKSPGAVDPHPGLFLPEHLEDWKKVSSHIHSYCCCRIHSRCCSIRRSRTEESERASSRNCSHCCCFRIHIPPQQERRSRIQIILQPLFSNRLLLETLHPLSHQCRCHIRIHSL